MSGFSPIITTASATHTDSLKAIGASNVIDRNLFIASLKEEIGQITSKPICFVYDSISSAATQQTAHDILSPGGRAVVVLPTVITPAEGKYISKTNAGHAHPIPAFYHDHLYGFLEKGFIVVSLVRLHTTRVAIDVVLAEQSGNFTRRSCWNRGRAWKDKGRQGVEIEACCSPTGNSVNIMIQLSCLLNCSVSVWQALYNRIEPHRINRLNRTVACALPKWPAAWGGGWAKNTQSTTPTLSQHMSKNAQFGTLLQLTQPNLGQHLPN